ncbi:MAG: EFR1 family ferrodoxin [Synergistaceae bacterium]|nr:EFR1 family ferrodoxin [Synergistaceae bacterium]
MRSGKIIIAVFTGTGNTLLMAEALSGELRSAGKDVSLAPMERPEIFESCLKELGNEAALGLAVPVACFSTYPTAWRFIDSLPEGRGREIFLLATMGGAGGGMEGPIRRAVTRKGYVPIGSLLVRMPGNYGNKTIDTSKNKKMESDARAEIQKYAKMLLDGSAAWGGGVPLASRLLASLAHGRKPWNLFHSMFPIEALAEKCTGCGLCQRICPEGNITMEGGRASLGPNCESCQRCVAFCRSGAICVPARPAARYAGSPLDSILRLIREAGETEEAGKSCP